MNKRQAKNISWSLVTRSIKSYSSFSGEKLRIYRKLTQQPSVRQRPGYKLKVLPPSVVWSDSKESLPGRDPYEVDVFSAGYQEVRNAFLIEGSNCVIQGRKMFVDEYRNEYPQVSDPRTDPLVEDTSMRLILSKGATPSAIKADEAFWLAGRFAKEFGHFLNSFLPRIHWMKSHPDWGNVPVILSRKMPEVHKDLFLMVAGDVPIIWSDEGESFKLKKAILVPSRVFSPYNVKNVTSRPQKNVFVEPEEFAALRDLLVKKFSAQFNPYAGRNFYLIREGYDRRVLTNRAAVYEIAGSFGFEEIDLARLDAENQILFWLGARTVIGELSSWVYLASIGKAVKVIGLNSNMDSQWWADLSGVTKVGSLSVDLILGEIVPEWRNDTSESAPHREWTLSGEGLDFLRNYLIKEPA